MLAALICQLGQQGQKECYNQLIMYALNFLDHFANKIS